MADFEDEDEDYKELEDSVSGAVKESEEDDSDDEDEESKPKFKYQKANESEEDYAKRLGWKPKEKWKGGEDGHLSAEDFLKEREDSVIAHKVRNKEMSSLNKAMMQQLAEIKITQQQQIKQQNEREKQMTELAYKRGLQDAKKRLKEAVSEGDNEAADQASDQIADIEKGYEKVKGDWKKQEEQQPIISAADQAILNEYIADNTWYSTNAEMRTKIDKKFMRLRSKGLSIPDALEESDDYIQVFIATLGKPRMKAPPSIAGEGRGSKAPEDNLTDEYKQGLKDFMEFFDDASKEDRAEAKAQYLSNLGKDAYRRR